MKTNVPGWKHAATCIQTHTLCSNNTTGLHYPGCTTGKRTHFFFPILVEVFGKTALTQFSSQARLWTWNRSVPGLLQMNHSRPMSGPRFMGCRGVNISGNYTEEKSLHSSSSCLFHTSLAAGLPNASFRPMSVKEPISRSGPLTGHFKPLACIPTPLDLGRQTGLCVPGAN